MAFLEKNNVSIYDTLIQQELKKHENEKLIARSLVKLPVKASQWLLLGGAAAGTAQTCIIAVTDKTLLMMLTKQGSLKAPEVAHTSVFPLEKVKLLSADRGWFGSSLSLSIDGKETKLRFISIPEWSTFEELAAPFSALPNPL